MNKMQLSPIISNATTLDFNRNATSPAITKRKGKNLIKSEDLNSKSKYQDNRM